MTRRPCRGRGSDQGVSMNLRPRLVFGVLAFGAALLAFPAPDTGAGDAPPAPPAAYVPPQGYVCYRAASPVTIDGRLDDPAWAAVSWSDSFMDIEGDRKPAPTRRTRVKMLW